MTEDINQAIHRLNALFLEVRAYKEAHPETKAGYYTNNYGSLLNAYREGDLGFDECIALLKQVRPLEELLAEYRAAQQPDAAEFS